MLPKVAVGGYAKVSDRPEGGLDSGGERSFVDGEEVGVGPCVDNVDDTGDGEGKPDGRPGTPPESVQERCFLLFS